MTSYHAGYDTDMKQKLQKEFIGDHYKALAATNALGMGIDKGNLRFIIHFDIPGSITAYYQEVGRCGRDGNEARGIILYDPSDRNIHEYFINSALPTVKDFQNVLETVSKADQPLGLNALKTLTGLHPTRVTIIIAELIEQKFLEKYSLHGKQVYRTLQKTGLPDLSRYKAQEEVKSHELKQMMHYGEQAQVCRMKTLRLSLGDEEAADCQACDCCLKKNKDFSVNAKKIHAINTWLNKRPLSIAPVAREKISSGISILDSKIRSPLFVHFMKQRMDCPEGTLGMDQELIELLKMHASNLNKKHKCVGIISVPSRTWQARGKVAEFLSNHLSLPLLDLLEWIKSPKTPR